MLLHVILRYNILQIVLAVGNYMNAGNYRVGGAIGFKIKFLTQVCKLARCCHAAGFFKHIDVQWWV